MSLQQLTSRGRPTPYPPVEESLSRQSLGLRLRTLRASRNMTAERAGEAAKVTGATWGRWERGIGAPTWVELVAIRDAFDVSLDFLLRPDDSEEIWLIHEGVENELRQLATSTDPYWDTPWAFSVSSQTRVEFRRSKIERLRQDLLAYRDSLPSRSRRG